MRPSVKLVLLAACSSCSPAPETLAVRINMAAKDVNAQAAMSGGQLENATSDWVGHNGPLDLRLGLNEREMRVAVSGSNGGVQLSTWLGLEEDYPEPRLNTITAVLQPQDLDWQPAWDLARGLCTQAREAGLTIEYGPSRPNTDRHDMNGVPACTIRDEVQSFDARVVPLGSPPSGRYRVELAVQAYFAL